MQDRQHRALTLLLSKGFFFLNGVLVSGFSLAGLCCIVELLYSLWQQFTSASFLSLSQAGRRLWFGPLQFLGRSWYPSPPCPSPPVLWVLCWSSPPRSPSSGHGVVVHGRQARWWSGWRRWCDSCAEPAVLWHSFGKPGLAACWPAAGRNSSGRVVMRCHGSAACEQVACSSSYGLERHLKNRQYHHNEWFLFLFSTDALIQKKHTKKTLIVPLFSSCLTPRSSSKQWSRLLCAALPPEYSMASGWTPS